LRVLTLMLSRGEFGPLELAKEVGRTAQSLHKTLRRLAAREIVTYEPGSGRRRRLALAGPGLIGVARRRLLASR
jgi:predicted transcriptional regulator